MSPKSKINKKDILDAAFQITKNQGYQNVNARSIAREMNCSTMPIFRVYKNMEELNIELIDTIYQYYRYFTCLYKKGDDELLEVSYAYVEFARKEHNLFHVLYVSDVGRQRTLCEVLDSDFNKDIINKIVLQYHISYNQASVLFRDVRFYIHGVATQVLSDSIILSEEDVLMLLKNAIKKFKD